MKKKIVLESENHDQKKEFHVIKLIPTAITMLSLCFGLTAIKMAITENFQLAIKYITIAAFLDFADGRVARAIKAESVFGAEMDSLCDFANFGITPGILMYIWTFKDVKIIGWGSCVFFIVCMATRLARFNVIDIHEKYQKTTINDDTSNVIEKPSFFLGLPAPAGAILTLLPMMLHYELSVEKHQYINIFYQLIISLMLISKIPIFSIKKLKINKAFKNLVIILIALLSTALVLEFFKTICFSIIIFLTTIPFSYFKYNKYVE